MDLAVDSQEEVDGSQALHLERICQCSLVREETTFVDVDQAHRDHVRNNNRRETDLAGIYRFVQEILTDYVLLCACHHLERPC